MTDEVKADTIVEPTKTGTTPEAQDDNPTIKTPAVETPAVKTSEELSVEVEQLKNEAARKDAVAKTAQKQARAERIARLKVEQELAAARNGGAEPKPGTPSDTITEAQVRQEVQMQIKDILLDDDKVREFVNSDPLVKELVKNNPFALIGDYFDAEDAVEQFKDRIDSMIKSKTQPKKESATEPKEVDLKPAQPRTDIAPKVEKKDPWNNGIDPAESSIRNKLGIK